ncbi:sugar nucleotide-binding protein [Methylotenera sp.]|uniref:sugar nucleotide-binding protein n=1 Tax=Methylotenera sp. TaxID=2051956 RepID=UPI0024876B86|nr:sugar nucleotide-binding protein [Methylotenera sp.]MDI1298531.1 sugar nucleotide-binding protein [Methylotenera sp.]
MKVLVLGGNGFIGSSIVKKLKQQGVQVLIGSRSFAENTDTVSIRMHSMTLVDDWLPVLKGIDVVVNSVGILRERNLQSHFQSTRETYDKVHNLAPTALAQACAKLNVRLIHISAIGLTNLAKSRFIRSKFAGEQGILSSGAQAILVRPSLLDGAGGYGARWFRRVAAWPVQFVMKSQGLIAPLQVTDLGEAVANLCQMNFDKLPKIIELGGNEVFAIEQYLTKLRTQIRHTHALQIAAPKVVVRLFSHIFDLLAWTPLSFGHFELMQGYNVPAKNMLPELLGHRPTEVGVNINVDCYEVYAISNSHS